MIDLNKNYDSVLDSQKHTKDSRDTLSKNYKHVVSVIKEQVRKGETANYKIGKALHGIKIERKDIVRILEFLGYDYGSIGAIIKYKNKKV